MLSWIIYITGDRKGFVERVTPVVTSVYSYIGDQHTRVTVIITVLAFAHAMSTTCRAGAGRPAR